MLTTGFKLYLGYAIGALTAAVLHGYTTGGTHLGPLTVGFKGAVGEHTGYAVLLAMGLVSGFMGLMLVAFRDAGARAAAEVLGLDVVPAQRPAGASYWPLIAAFGAGTLMLGLVLNAAVFILGLVILAVVGVEWMMQAWADRATGDPAVNSELRNRIMAPIELPVGAALAIIAVPLAASRLFLAVSAFSAVWVATGIATIVFITAIVIATKPRLTRNIVAGAVLFGGIALITGGIIAASIGQRSFEHHEAEHDEPAGASESGEGS